MRVKFGNKILEIDRVYHAGGTDRFVSVYPTSSKFDNSCYIIDCEESGYARWLMAILLTKGYFNASGVDYDNSNDPTWFEYCRNKTEEQKVFSKWVNGGK